MAEPARLAFLAVFLAALAQGGAAARGSDPAVGLWLTENGRAIVRIAPCEDSLCGRTVWLAEPERPDGAPKRDRRNPDPALRGRTLCGLVLFRDFMHAAPGVWEDGALYSPRHGETFSARLVARDRETLEVRGYLGVPFLGRSQTWTRVASARGGCR
jgi:uncharacterized protein (DUF2147 family)